MIASIPFHASQKNPHDFVGHVLTVDRKTGRAYVRTTLTAKTNGRQTREKRELREFFASATVTETRSLLELIGKLAQGTLQRHLESREEARQQAAYAG
ncbi:hypothetical protein [Sphingomonas dokdonensis]|uniref:Uncharacterized protein n=1 Tax=Sphingomonas dokdonensis TaxID=344880 RepID=A0A245ZKZ4_9SPHN|nr:hypothetical protein [Sphingomonas dokdonensis]OWK30412.1 hypothetical protein SPDO_20980 [Sphingomonas dokdonensis]